jgi:hypothetical protein
VPLNKHAGTGTFRTELRPKLSTQMRHLIGYRLSYKNDFIVPSRSTANNSKFIFYLIKSSVSDSYHTQHKYAFLGKAESESRRVKIKWRPYKGKI